MTSAEPRAGLGRPGAGFDRQLVDRVAAALRGPARHTRSRRRSAAATTQVTDALAHARESLGMDLALLGEVRRGREVVAAMAGDAESFGLRLGMSMPLKATLCHLLLEGRLPNVVPDVRAHRLASELDVTRAGRVGAYIGVPLTGRDARLYVLCCLAHERRPGLSRRHVVMLRGWAQSIARHLGGPVLA